MEEKSIRYHLIDSIRGITIISMILYHGSWDMVHIYHYDWAWFDSNLASIWQLSICLVFIFLAGFCWPISKHPIKHGLIVFFCGALVSLVTLIVMPEEPILFGILTFLGSAMLFMVFLDQFLKKIPSYIGILFCILLFIISYPVNEHYLNFSFLSFGIQPLSFLQMVRLPSILYTGDFATFLGFTAPGFISADYYSFFPWFFLFSMGYFFYPIMKENLSFQKLSSIKIKPLSFIGRHSLLIYVLHQPIVYGILIFVHLL
ncbi:MAG: heparan-alpha-glucosaminide N-acetyltransferase domain-containing protein [Eubacteriales bacterium]